jgi:hypothetical protein
MYLSAYSSLGIKLKIYLTNILQLSHGLLFRGVMTELKRLPRNLMSGVYQKNTNSSITVITFNVFLKKYYLLGGKGENGAFSPVGNQEVNCIFEKVFSWIEKRKFHLN